MTKTKQKTVWLGPAAKRHAPHVVAAAGAVVAAYHYMGDPDLIYLGALATFSSGVVGGAIEAGRWIINRISDAND